MGPASDRLSLTASRPAGVIWRWSTAARATRLMLRRQRQEQRASRRLCSGQTRPMRTEIIAAVSETVKSLGRLDILINMASIYQKTPNPNGAAWSASLDTNAKSAFLFSIHAAPIMKQGGGGRIINFSDWLPATDRPHYKGYTPYYVSKASVVALTQTLALEFAPEILVNAMAPGPILEPPGLTPEENMEVIEATPLRRWGGAAEIAKTVLFLVDSDFITGECIRVDGGRHLY